MTEKLGKKIALKRARLEQRFISCFKAHNIVQSLMDDIDELCALSACQAVKEVRFIEEE